LSSEKQEGRFLLLQCHTPLFDTVYRRPDEGGLGALCFCFWGLYFGLFFGVGSFWKGKELLKGKIAEGKRIVEGKMLKRG
jgi:hypothetical protein